MVLSPPAGDTRDLSWIGPSLVIPFAADFVASASQPVRAPKTVAHVTISNPVEQAVDVDLKHPGGSWLPVAVVDAKTTTTVDDVIDVGGPWIIRYSVAGEELTTVHRS